MKIYRIAVRLLTTFIVASLPYAVSAQAEAVEEQMSIDSDIFVSLDKIELQKVGKGKLEGYFSEQLHEIAKKAATDQSGLLLDWSSNGQITTTRIIPENDENIFVTPELIDALNSLGRDGLIFEEAKSLDTVFQNFGLNIGAGTQRSIPLNDVVGFQVPPALLAHPNYVPLPSSFGQGVLDCAATQRRFGTGVEENLFQNGFGLNRTAAEIDELATKTEAFEAACLESVSPASHDNEGLPLKYLAILSDTKDGPFCMAANLGAGRFITANHCRFDAQNRLRTNVTLSLADLSVKNVKIVFDASGSEPLSDKAEDDYAEFSAPSLLATSKYASLKVAQIDHFLEIRIIGYFALSDIRRSFAERSLPSWTSALRTSKNIGIKYCQIVDYTPPKPSAGTGCIQHGCQAFPGYSGAPMFTKVNDIWQLVGIHVAVNGRNKICSKFSGRDKGILGESGNLGVQLPYSVINFVNN